MNHYATSDESEGDCHVMAKIPCHVKMWTNIIMGMYILVDQTGYVYCY